MFFMALRKVVVIAGPTASGKSQLAVDVARACRGVVINADSMQVYPDTPVLSAIPSAAERGGIEHCLYGVFPSSKNGTVVEWLVLAAGESAGFGAKANCRSSVAVQDCILTI